MNSERLAEYLKMVICVCHIHAYKILTEKSEGKSQIERPSCRWEDNIKIHFKEMRFACVDWIKMAQDRVHWWAVEDPATNIWIQLRTNNFLVGLTITNLLKKDIVPWK